MHNQRLSFFGTIFLLPLCIKSSDESQKKSKLSASQPIPIPYNKHRQFDFELFPESPRNRSVSPNSPSLSTKGYRALFLNTNQFSPFRTSPNYDVNNTNTPPVPISPTSLLAAAAIMNQDSSSPNRLRTSQK
jgi:hypothetical protein